MHFANNAKYTATFRTCLFIAFSAGEPHIENLSVRTSGEQRRGGGAASKQSTRTQTSKHTINFN
jgi:hypothetical protein